MSDFDGLKKAAFKYWERRRIIYNLALVPPALIGYALTNTLNWVGAPPQTQYSYIIPLFALAAVGANICYSFAYALEFFFASENVKSRWLGCGRTIIFVGGVLFGMLLALPGGSNIAQMEWHHGVKALD